MKKLLPILILFICISPAYAQQNNCGNGVPCGPLPWSMPVMPILRSPTPMPTLAVTSSSINPGVATSTPVPIYTPTPLALDTSSIDQQMSILTGLLNQTPVFIQTGTPLGLTNNIITNGRFENWTGSFPTDSPTGWNVTISGGQTSSAYVTDASNAARMVSPGTYITLSQPAMSNGVSYTASITVINVSAGSLSLQNNSGATLLNINAPGNHSVSFTANGSTFFITRGTSIGNNDITFTNLRLVPSNNVVNELGTSAGTFFGYARGLSAESFGPLAPLIVLTLTSFILIVSVKTITFILPVLAALFGIIRKIVSTVLEFLPL